MTGPSVSPGPRLGRRALTAASDVIAPFFLGATLVRTDAQGVVAVRITEVEAYGATGADAASHAHGGLTARNAVMFERPGLLYVYFVYGMHWCANVVCAPKGVGSAVLLRAGEVVRGLDLARERRPTARRDLDLARGPANLAKALGITGTDNGVDLLSSTAPTRLVTARPSVDSLDVVSGPRIGITREVDRRWRWWLKSAPSVSRARGSARHTSR